MRDQAMAGSGMRGGHGDGYRWPLRGGARRLGQLCRRARRRAVFAADPDHPGQHRPAAHRLVVPHRRTRRGPARSGAAPLRGQSAGAGWAHVSHHRDRHRLRPGCDQRPRTVVVRCQGAAQQALQRPGLARGELLARHPGDGRRVPRAHRVRHPGCAADRAGCRRRQALRRVRQGRHDRPACRHRCARQRQRCLGQLCGDLATGGGRRRAGGRQLDRRQPRACAGAGRGAWLRRAQRPRTVALGSGAARSGQSGCGRLAAGAGGHGRRRQCLGAAVGGCGAGPGLRTDRLGQPRLLRRRAPGRQP
ncbi:hypothetical protein NB713_000197 [Xanthomonas sacchari]|nr:hypothetical protein [Xanthomonas sacchari]